MRSMLLILIVLALAGPQKAAASDVQGQVVVRGARDNANAVIFIDRIPGKKFQPPEEPVVLDQVNLTFLPHVLPILAGTTVAFPNKDEIRHNVFSPGPPRFDLGTYPQGQTKYYLFDKPGVWTLLCNVHAEMSAYVVVAETPYFTRTEKDGKFLLKDVPPGKYTLKVWHARAKAADIPIEVDGATVTVSPIDLKR